MRIEESTGYEYEYIVGRNARKEMLTKQSFSKCKLIFSLLQKKGQFRKDRVQQHLHCPLHHIPTKYLNTSILLKFPQMLYQNFSLGALGVYALLVIEGPVGQHMQFYLLLLSISPHSTVFKNYIIFVAAVVIATSSCQVVWI